MQPQIVTASLVVIPEAEPVLVLSHRWKRLDILHLMREAVDILDQNFDDGRRTVVATFQFLHADSNILVALDHLTHPDEGADDANAHLDRPVAA